ncbi:hypothetical protein MMC17_005261 [Xylographa soralifera]|nr:hypothetical protein [Xylographa soralifera]
MASGFRRRNENPRGDRLGLLFHKVVSGEQTLTSSQSAKRFIEAFCDQSDHVRCVEKIISSPQGLLALQSALRIDISSMFLNTSASALLRYIQAPELALICGGDFLRVIILTIVDPPVFWTALINALKSDRLSDEALQCFSWLLLQLISLPDNKSTTYYGVASDISTQKALLGSSVIEIRRNGQKIKHIIETVTNPTPDGSGAGGRHDNDFADFRKIAILPTPDEILSEEPPFLRQASEIDEWSESGRFAIHVENQYRLYREDMLRGLHEELLVALNVRQGRQRGLVIDGLVVKGMECKERHFWALRLQCTKDIPQLPVTTQEKRKKFITENRNILQHNSLACLTTEGRVIALVTIDRDEDLLAQIPPSLCVQFSGGPASVTNSLLQVKVAEHLKLVQLNTALFAYEPILKRLQGIKRLLLSEEIVNWKIGDALQETTTSTSPSIINLTSNVQIDLSCNLQNSLRLPKATHLDVAQAKCLLAGLNQRLSLVQGPPGTGKSFIGALIGKAIYIHTSQKMLIVCYTNHALDQFLEDLLDVGIPTEDIVRLGAATKSSPRIQSLLLSAQQSNYNLKAPEWAIINKRKLDAAQETTRLRNAFQDYHASSASKADIMGYLEFDSENPDFYDAFLLPDDVDGMERVGKGGKAVNKYYLLDRWARGQDAGIYSGSASEYEKIWHIPPAQRMMALQRWKNHILKERVSKLYECGSRLNEAQTDINALYNERDRRIIQGKRIIGCTTTAAAKYVEFIQSACPNVLLVEEAGEILESHILTALGAETEQMILIGDHKQLRPKAHHDLTVEKGYGYDLNRSLFERLVLKGFPHQVLSGQHRMRPEISNLVRQLTYPDLVDAPSTRSRPDLRGFQSNLIFVSHDKEEEDTRKSLDMIDGSSTSSIKNMFEAVMTLKCVRYLAQQGYGTDDIVVLTPYLAQLRLLIDVLGKENDPVLNDLDSYDLVKAGLLPAATAAIQKRKLRISTVDNYQGEESDIVVISLTRSNDRHDIGFMSSPERLNVLLSRARNALILIGNPTTFLKSRKGQDLWRRFFSLLKQGSHVYEGFPVKCERHPDRTSILRDPKDFELCPDGGCNEPCNVTLQCDVHTCPQRCHQLFDHSKMACQQIVKAKCPTGHVLAWKCSASKPVPCRTCENEKREKERKIQAEFERQQKRDRERQEHVARMAELDEQIRNSRETVADSREFQDMRNALEQKRQDLAVARLHAERSSRSTIEPTKPHDNNTATIPSRPQAVSHPKGVSSSETPTVNEVRDNVRKVSQVQEAPSPSESEWERQKRLDNISNDAIDSLMAMTGLEEVKAQVLTIKARIDTAVRQNTDLKNERFGMVLLGNPGTGKTTVARLYAKFLTSLGILPGSEFVETTGSRLASEGIAKAKSHIETILNAGGGAFFLDEAYQLALGHNSGGASVLDYLLAEIENQVGKIVFILAGYNKQMEKFFEHNQGLDSRMPYRLQFADYKDKELLQMLGQLIKKKYDSKMKVEEGDGGLYARIAIRRLERGRGREGFGNARALQNMFAKISERQADRLHRERARGAKPDDFLFTKEDLIGPDPSIAIVESAAWKELQDLIGLAMVKESIQSLIDQIQLNYKRELLEKTPVEVSLNRVFLGSPGTGKTSVAKLYGQVLSDLGLLTNGEVVLKNPADFVGSVLGETEKNTKAILKATEGKVLVIDEAYMLYSGGSGTGNTSDPYKTAVVDTIVAEVQSVIGEDRCVLLLGYKEKLEEMFQNTNPGLSRRFPLDDAFYFEDFDDDQLRAILALKLRKQDLDATHEAKDVAIAVLARSRRRLNFGNAGEVENMISHAKASYQKRDSAIPPSERSVQIVFEPQDFDANFNRSANATVSCRELFKDVVGCDEIVSKLEGYMLSAASMRANGVDPQQYIPFNFIFKGPPGTGKTTTARKMGDVFYDMGFLSSPEVLECSATNLVAGYVGQTALKTVQQLEKALGKVLFIDEAYRLGEGAFATEAINELVDSLTRPRFAGKIIVILAGYESDMNKLLSLNQGLSSRFAEEVIFRNMEPEACLELLERSLRKTGITVDHADKDRLLPVVISLFQELSIIDSWGNGRDVQTISKSIMSAIFRKTRGLKADLSVSYSQMVNFLKSFLAERESRSLTKNPRICDQKESQAMPAKQHVAPPAIRAMHSKIATQGKSEEQNPTPDKDSQIPGPGDVRDDGVSDLVWRQLQSDKARQEIAEQRLRDDVATVEHEAQQAASKEATSQATAALAAALAASVISQNQARDDEANELKRRQEEARLKHVTAQRAREAVEEKLRMLREETERRRREDAKAQAKLREMGVCVAGFRWINQGGGYRCAGGSHFVSDVQLGV